jgi:hypothetical protein
MVEIRLFPVWFKAASCKITVLSLAEITVYQKFKGKVIARFLGKKLNQRVLPK